MGAIILETISIDQPDSNRSEDQVVNRCSELRRFLIGKSIVAARVRRSLVRKN